MSSEDNSKMVDTLQQTEPIRVRLFFQSFPDEMEKKSSSSTANDSNDSNSNGERKAGEEYPWMLQGTGLLTCAQSQRLGVPAFIVRGEVEKEENKKEKEKEHPVEMSNDNDSHAISSSSRCDQELLHTKVYAEPVYEMVDSGVIMWCDSYLGHSVALSFQSSVDCLVVWQLVQDFLASSRRLLAEGEGLPEDNDMESTSSLTSSLVSLPPVVEWTVTQIRDIILTCPYLQKDTLVHLLMEAQPLSESENNKPEEESTSALIPSSRGDSTVDCRPSSYLQKLLHLFAALDVKAAESEVALDLCFQLYLIFKNVIALNDQGIFAHLIEPDNMELLLGVLEYDPDYYFNKQFVPHRLYLKKCVIFREVVPIPTEKDLFQRIHLPYRLNYLRDVALARCLDEVSLMSFGAVVRTTSMAIVRDLLTTPAFIEPLYAKVGEWEQHLLSAREVAALLGLVLEGMQSVRTQSVEMKTDFFDGLFTAGLIGACCSSLEETQNWAPCALTGCGAGKTASCDNCRSFAGVIRSRSMELLFLSVLSHHDPFLGVLLREGSGEATTPPTTTTGPSEQTLLHRLLVLLGAGISNATWDIGVRRTGLECLRVLFGVDVSVEDMAQDMMQMAPSFHAARDAVLSHWYSHCVQLVIKPLMHIADAAWNLAEAGMREPVRGSVIQKEVLSTVSLCFDILTVCVERHGYRLKLSLLSHNTFARICRLMVHPDSNLALEAVHFFRAVLSMRDDFYSRYIVRHDLLGLLFTALRRNSPRQNLLGSAILGVFSQLSGLHNEMLLAHVMNAHADDLLLLEQPLDIAASFREAWELQKEMPAAVGNKLVRRQSEMMEEEAFFSSDNGSETSHPADQVGIRIPSVGAGVGEVEGSADSLAAVNTNGTTDGDSDSNHLPSSLDAIISAYGEDDDFSPPLPPLKKPRSDVESPEFMFL